MWMNLHALPAGQHMFTVFIGPADESWCEEIDVVASSRAGKDAILEAAADELADYDMENLHVLAICDQTDGYTVFRKGN